MKKKFKLFCFGFGQVARYFVKNLIKKNFNFTLVTTNTSETELKKIADNYYKSYYFDNVNYDKNLLKELNSSNKVLISIPPKKKNDLVLKVFDKNFKKNKFDWVTYLSSTSVYGNKEGEWVDENTIPTPSTERGVNRLKAEDCWIKYFKSYNLPVQIFRLSGIYSYESNVMKRLQMGKLKIINKKNHYFSRIHVEDIAEILTLSLKKFESGQIYNISDNYPCSNEEIANYAANLIKSLKPKVIKPEAIENNMLKEFYKDSKKVNNKKMKTFFNYDLKYPTYKEGLNMIINYKI
jgi:nucleoside-diphosphate-sugar epimerase